MKAAAVEKTSIEGKYVVSKHYIFKVQQETKTHVSGFDLLTEACVLVEKSNVVLLPQAVIDLIGCKRAMLVLILDNFKELPRHEMSAKYLGLSERTFYRAISDHGLN